MADGYIHEFPGQQTRLTYEAPDDVMDEIALARLALDGVFTLGEDFFEPLAVDLRVALYDTAIDYPLNEPAPAKPHFWLRREEVPAGARVAPAWEKSEIATVDVLSPATIASWLAGALDQEVDDPAAHRLCWQEMLFRSMRVKLPGSVDIQNDALRLGSGAGHVEHPVERAADGLWVWGPIEHKTLTAPVEVVISNEAGLFTLDLFVHWSLWTQQGTPGHAMVERAVARLVSRGWQGDMQ